MIDIDVVFINQLLTQRCDALECCTRALLLNYCSEVITATIVGSAVNER